MLRPAAAVLLLLPSLSLTQSDSYGAPALSPISYSPPEQQSYQAPRPSYTQQAPQQIPNYDYYKHETHHFYHAGPPRVVHVKVPVTQKPYVVQVPQNVPIKFVPVQVPPPPTPPVQVVQVQPQQAYSQPQHVHHY